MRQGARSHLRRQTLLLENASLAAEVVAAPFPREMSLALTGVTLCRYGPKAGGSGRHW